ncbi:capsular polysaccharide biosynthesis protein [Roseivirga ehrenbergii]|uniref:Capsule biosynthesis protein n=1 Tax=Roseivirga ehrenbergii (strain DSM 102268 / JCM 13514 / KCTC 12282 / NCIMB 14502 / KMM 6017) TaxID=279360 RepID=A0A150XEC5_ROSEK|nr:hypothetical protein [Roseivirga ehrenbergii]KYG77051.1 hypothetical protein MB14_02285 [Roseivirga ehrenbergii]TCL14446.1 capsular polysaccharide biosynthesis protein [Roseivirga ehrenbergii]
MKSINTLVVNFENAYALKGLPFFQKELPGFKVVGLVARNIDLSVHTQYAQLPIYEKNLSIDNLINYSPKSDFSAPLQEYLLPFEEQIHYHVNRYFDTTLAFDYSLIRQKIIYYALDIIKNTQAGLLYFGVTPHDPLSYLLCLIGHHLGIKVVILSRCDALNSYQLYEEIGDHINYVKNAPQELDSGVVKYKHKHVESSLLALTKSEPSYMVKQKRDGGSLMKKLRYNLFVKKRVTLSGWQRYKKKKAQKNVYTDLVSISNENELKSLEKKILYFPLHFQPELTTSPDGGMFSQQWSAIKAVADNFKEGYVILVKEHPSQFLINSKHVRSELFYKGILSIGSNIKLVSLDLSSEKILKQTSGVITITGTVGFEAILNEKPVLFFGDAKYNTIRGAFNFLKEGDLAVFAQHVDGAQTFNKSEVINDFMKLAESKFYFCYDKKEAHEVRHLKAIKALLSEYQTYMYSTL